MQKPGMVVGQKGVKYGLIKRKDEEKPLKPAPGRLAAFGGDSDSDEDNVGVQVARQAARKVADTKVQDMYAAALADDPNAFEYDILYDSMQEQKAAPKQQEKLARQPKYIASLLEQAEVRKREQGITYERMLLKERQKEDHMYDNTEKFITSAYRRKLEEDKKWQESQRLKELEEERNDVTKRGNMNNFYTNLTKNVAMGGSTAAAARSKHAAPVQDSEAAEAGESLPDLQQPEHHEQPSSPGGGQQQQDGEQRKDEELKQQQRHDSPDEARHAAPSAADSPRGSKAAEGRQQADQQQEPQGAQPPPQQQPTGPVAGKRKNTDDAVAAARERYLARKRQQGSA